MKEVEKIQCKFIKSSLGLNSFCRNTQLLQALKIPRVSDSFALQELRLFKTMFLSRSYTSAFYGHMYKQYLRGYSLSPRNLMYRVAKSCEIHNISLVRYICDIKYASSQRRSIIQYPVDDGCC